VVDVGKTPFFSAGGGRCDSDGRKLCTGPAMGSFILLSWCSFLGMVLPLSLFHQNYRFASERGANEDVKKGLKIDMTFNLGQPFKPFEQLMGVLPSRSRKLLPEAFRVGLYWTS
jgi:hypothetical protein